MYMCVFLTPFITNPLQDNYMVCTLYKMFVIKVKIVSAVRYVMMVRHSTNIRPDK